MSKRGKEVSPAALISTVAIIAIAAATVIGFAIVNPESDSTPLLVSLLGIIASTVPSLLAAQRADQVARDVRNGVLTEKVTEGTKTAIEESGVLTRHGPVASASLEALTALLAERRGEFPAAQQALTDALNQESDERKDAG